MQLIYRNASGALQVDTNCYFCIANGFALLMFWVFVGKFTDTNGASFCQFCLGGKYGHTKLSVAETGHCVPCPKGKYQYHDGWTDCNECPSGKHTANDHNGASACAPCQNSPMTFVQQDGDELGEAILMGLTHNKKGNINAAQRPGAKPEAHALCGGQTSEYDWRKHGMLSLYVDVDISKCSFRQRPNLVTSIQGIGGQWQLRGTSCLYEVTASGFRMIVTPSFQSVMSGKLELVAASRKWRVNWIGDSGRFSGTTSEGFTEWRWFYFLIFASLLVSATFILQQYVVHVHVGLWLQAPLRCILTSHSHTFDLAAFRYYLYTNYSDQCESTC